MLKISISDICLGTSQAMIGLNRLVKFYKPGIRIAQYSICIPNSRQKIIDVYTQTNKSQRQISKQFNVALSFVQKLLKQYRETGNIAPKVRTQQTPTKLNQSSLNVLR